MQPPIAQLQAAAELAGGIIAYIVWRIGNHAALTIQTAFRQFLARQCLAAKVREKGVCARAQLPAVLVARRPSMCMLRTTP